VAGCATPTGSAGHASATASLKLTFHLDHSAGAHQYADVEHHSSFPSNAAVGRRVSFTGAYCLRNQRGAPGTMESRRRRNVERRATGLGSGLAAWLSALSFRVPGVGALILCSRGLQKSPEAG